MSATEPFKFEDRQKRFSVTCTLFQGMESSGGPGYGFCRPSESHLFYTVQLSIESIAKLAHLSGDFQPTVDMINVIQQLRSRGRQGDKLFFQMNCWFTWEECDNLRFIIDEIVKRLLVRLYDSSFPYPLEEMAAADVRQQKIMQSYRDRGLVTTDLDQEGLRMFFSSFGMAVPAGLSDEMARAAIHIYNSLKNTRYIADGFDTWTLNMTEIVLSEGRRLHCEQAGR